MDKLVSLALYVMLLYLHFGYIVSINASHLSTKKYSVGQEVFRIAKIDGRYDLKDKIMNCTVFALCEIWACHDRTYAEYYPWGYDSQVCQIFTYVSEKFETSISGREAPKFQAATVGLKRSCISTTLQGVSSQTTVIC
jgi:hypothetical protein